MVKHILLIASTVVVCSCNQLDIKGMIMPTSEGVERRFEQSMQMNKDLRAESVSAQESYTFYVATDPHINETHTCLSIFNDALRNDDGASFGVILGDCTDKRDNIHRYLEALSYEADRHSCDHRIYHVLGNHDLFFNGWREFKENVGAAAYWFEVTFPEGKDLYISLDTATGTLGRKQTRWLKSFLTENRSGYRHCIILTHTNFFYTDNSQITSGNMTLEESYALIDFFGEQKVSLVLQGHDHYREDLTYDGVRYTVLGAIKDEVEAPEYLKVNIGQDNIELEWQMITKK
jgi:3',5'-cyclic AMP phosphodiesterase CpdA